MKGRDLIEAVVENRVKMIRQEVKAPFPDAEITHHFTEEGRAHILIIWEGTVIGEEFVETAESWRRPERRREYLRPLVNKARLVVIVPDRHSRAARMKLLDFNHWWLFYYLVFSYDRDGNLKQVGRPGPGPTPEGYA